MLGSILQFTYVVSRFAADRGFSNGGMQCNFIQSFKIHPKRSLFFIFRCLTGFSATRNHF